MEDEDEETAPVEQEIEVEFDIIHPHYPRRFNYHDIALAKLKRPVGCGGERGSVSEGRNP